MNSMPQLTMDFGSTRPPDNHALPGSTGARALAEIDDDAASSPDATQTQHPLPSLLPTARDCGSTQL